MHIRSVRLRDWKAYVDTSIEFPRPTRKKNVVLIGAMNGYGKTTLLEALILGLFGRDGLSILARAVMRDGAERITQSYDDFLERGIHARAIEQGRTSASVEVTLGDEDTVLTIQRIWHFSGSGRHRREDEEVRIFTGEERDLVRVPKIEDRDDFLRSFVAQNFLPVHLAQFFLFDGEQVQRLAQRDMSTQVRAGIEGMLGVPVLRELTRDLTSYAQARRNSVKNVGDETLERLRSEVRSAEAALKTAEDALGGIEPLIEPLKARRDQLVKDLGSFQGGNYANLRELMEARGRLERERDREKERLAGLLREDIAIALAGKELRTTLRTRVQAEDERSKWENGKTQSEGGLGKLIAALKPIPADPPLTAAQYTAVEGRVRIAWESVWHPPPAACAEGYRHQHLGPSDRALVLERLSRVETMGLGSLSEILEQIDDFDKQLRKIDARIAQQHGVSDKVETITSELERLHQDIAEKETRARELGRQVEGLKGDLHHKKPALAKLLEGYESAQPALRRAGLADRISDVLETVIGECYPLHIGEVAKEMTAAVQAMAHKTLVKAVKIEPDCTVRLLGDAGRDMRGMDASAGENQIFALSLIAAIGLASKREFPIVMDTPLARLDPNHRQRVLKYFTEKVGEQVILLSQPDEVLYQLE